MKFKNIKVLETCSFLTNTVRVLGATRKGWFRDKEVLIYVGVKEWFYLHNYKVLNWQEVEELQRWMEVNVE